PAWTWFRGFLGNEPVLINFHAFASGDLLTLMASSTIVVFLGIGIGLWLYGSKSPAPETPDVLEQKARWIWVPLRDRLYVDEFYGATVIAFFYLWARVADWLDRRIWGGIVAGVALAFRGLAHLDRLIDNFWINDGFDKGCEELSTGGGLLARVQTGRVQTYLRLLALGFVVLVAILIWSSRP
ncbi:MAG TPA: NADH-quinone oxidoreductase subunit L, partial [Terracidiphilus sp.]